MILHPEVRVWERVGTTNTWALEASIITCASLTWESRFNEPGTWEMSLAYDETAQPLIPKTRLVTIDYLGSRSTWRIEEQVISIGEDAGSRNLTVGGSGALALLSDDPAWPDPSKTIANQPTDARDGRLYTGKAETVIRDIVLDNYITREAKPLTLPANLLRGDDSRARSKFENLMELVVRKARVGGLGVDVTLVDTSGGRAELQLRIWEPEDLSTDVRLSEKIGNIATWTYTATAPKLTRAVVSGPSGYKIVTTPESDAAALEWGGHRTKLVASVTSFDDPDLIQAGEEALKDAEGSVNLALEPTDTEGLMAFRDYDVGDKVTAELETGLLIVDVISGIKVNIDDGLPQVTPTFGDPAANDPMVSLGQVIRAQDRRLREVERITPFLPVTP